jgi:hypothetical protein
VQTAISALCGAFFSKVSASAAFLVVGHRLCRLRE